MKKRYLVVLLALLIMLVSSCVVITPPVRNWVLTLSWDYGKLDEHYYWTNTYSFYISSDVSAVKIVLDCTVSPWYGYEVWLMSESQLSSFKNSGKVNVTARWIANSGYWVLQENLVAPGYYHVVIDNTDYGWVKTNFDGWNDYVRTNMKLWLYKTVQASVSNEEEDPSEPSMLTAVPLLEEQTKR